MRDRLEQAIAAGADYVLTLQSPNGCWTDWALPPGSSSVWSTAYVGYRLLHLPQSLCIDSADAVRDASHWLLVRQSADGGWGYSAAVGPDADSTSFAILLLKAVLGCVPQTAYDHLLSYQQKDGGFATYRDAAAGSWSVSHPDVTPVALLALLPHLGVRDERIRRGIARVLWQQTTNGIWHSFWWHSHLYGTAASLALLRSLGVPSRRPVQLPCVESANAFETALLLACEIDAAVPPRSAAVARWVERLLGEQRPDGSWASTAILRITRRDCFAPWAETAPGPLFEDPHRLFTSATVLGALSRAHALRAQRTGSATMRGQRSYAVIG
jgi:squalene cyclase